MDLYNKKVLVVGTGISGVGAATLLEKAGAVVILYDANEKLLAKDIYEKLPKDTSIEVRIGEPVYDAQLLVISPGVPVDSELVLEYKNKNVPVWGEIELAYNFEKGKVIAITGTNGKTTTTTLVGEIMKAYRDKTFVVGNIGNPYTNEVLNTSEDSYTVAEISSFQLETIHKFAPAISAILNITPDHLNRHKTMENYVAVKESICSNQSSDSVCVVNYDDEYLKDFAPDNCKVVHFSRKIKPQVGAYMNGDVIMYTDGKQDISIVNVHDMQIIGTHNYENVMAAVAITINMGVPVDIIIDTILGFKGVEHRIEYVNTINGVTYYNDSKGTNPDASIKAIEAMTKPTVLIAGGYDKKSEFDDFILAFNGKIKKLVLLGVTKEKIADTAKKYGFTDYVFANDLKEAVDLCFECAVNGDAVLLSPACASWDMFTGYEQRGRLFKEYVNMHGNV